MLTCRVLTSSLILCVVALFNLQKVTAQFPPTFPQPTQQTQRIGCLPPPFPTTPPSSNSNLPASPYCVETQSRVQGGCSTYNCSFPLSKPGYCPNQLPQTMECDIKCTTDFNCQGTQKCCTNGCGTTCMNPTEPQCNQQPGRPPFGPPPPFGSGSTLAFWPPTSGGGSTGGSWPPTSGGVSTGGSWSPTSGSGSTGGTWPPTSGGGSTGGTWPPTSGGSPSGGTWPPTSGGQPPFGSTGPTFPNQPPFGSPPSQPSGPPAPGSGFLFSGNSNPFNNPRSGSNATIPASAKKEDPAPKKEEPETKKEDPKKPTIIEDK